MGELFVAGYNVAAGYVAQRDPERFIKNPFSDDFGNFCCSMKHSSDGGSL